MPVAEQGMWCHYTRPNGAYWTPWDVAALIGTVREIEMPHGLTRRYVLDARMSDDPRRADVLLGDIPSGA